jgi:hypothetical protein
MNRCLTCSLAISMTLTTLAIPLRAANKPRAEKTGGAYTRCRASSMHSKTSQGTMASRQARCAANDAHRSSLYAAS